jgi:two-component system sensor histidine kinase/response regulator
VVALTANAFDDDRQRCLAAGMDAHLSKPVNSAVLHQTLLHWLDRAAAPGWRG